MNDGKSARSEPSEASAGGAIKIGVALAALAFAALLFSQTFVEISAFAKASQGRGPFFYPRFLITAIAALALVMLVKPIAATEEAIDGLGMRRLLLMFIVVIAYAVLLSGVGFLLASMLFALSVPLLLGYRRIKVVVAVATGFSIGVWWLFENVFLIILPRSVWLTGV